MPTFFNGIEITNADKLYTWTIYDTPGWYVARRHEVMPGGGIELLEQGIRSKDISELREIFLSRGLTCINRQPDDEPDIIETWI